MKTKTTLRYDTIILCVLCCFMTFWFPVISYAQEEAPRAEVSSFEEFTSSLGQMQRTGGTVVLTQDITVGAQASYAYSNGRYQKEVVIQTNGHTIHVEGSLELWPFLTIRGDGSQGELLHVHPGGELRLISIGLDAGETGTAVIQEEGAFLLCTSEAGMGLPAFSCVGQILSSQAVTAAADWGYHPEKLPIVRIPEGTDFTADLLPHRVPSVVNRDRQEYEEALPVIWDETTFPTEHKRTLVRGKFPDGYAPYQDYVPLCLVVWESETSPFFLNVYLESATPTYDMVFMYGEAPQAGTVYVQSSQDGESWTDLSGTDGYTPVDVEEHAGFSWLLSYDRQDSAQERPRYYRLLQVLEDGTQLLSDALELTDDWIFTAADIGGGRGGETSPNEGEHQLSNGRPDADPVDEPLPSTPPEPTPEPERESHGGAETGAAPGEPPAPTSPPATPAPSGTVPDAQPSPSPEHVQEPHREEGPTPAGTVEGASDPTGVETLAGIAIVVCILAASTGFFVFRRKK